MRFAADEIRDASRFTPTKHLRKQMRKSNRNISFHQVTKTIEEGKFNDEGGNEERHAEYRLEFPGPDLIVIVDAENMLVLTTYWDDEQGASGGAL